MHFAHDAVRFWNSQRLNLKKELICVIFVVLLIETVMMIGACFSRDAPCICWTNSLKPSIPSCSTPHRYAGGEHSPSHLHLTFPSIHIQPWYQFTASMPGKQCMHMYNHQQVTCCRFTGFYESMAIYWVSRGPLYLMVHFLKCVRGRVSTVDEMAPIQSGRHIADMLDLGATVFPSWQP